MPQSSKLGTGLKTFFFYKTCRHLLARLREHERSTKSLQKPANVLSNESTL